MSDTDNEFLSGDIVLCDNCKGKGIIYYQRVIDYHNNYKVNGRVECSTCKGSGRMVKKVTKTPFVPDEPYDPPED